jgi:hypothetical protein
MKPDDSATPSTTDNAPRASLPQVISAVFWSFFGVRKGHAMRQDAVTIKPAQVIVVGIILAALLVIGLLTLVRFIIGQAH